MTLAEIEDGVARLRAYTGDDTQTLARQRRAGELLAVARARKRRYESVEAR
jgi:hypothetical protein